MTPSDRQRASSQPLDANTTICLLGLSTSDAEVALETGVYELRLGPPASTNAAVRLGATAASLASLAPGADAEAGFLVAPGDVITVAHDATVGDGKLHAILMSAGSETLVITRKAVP